MLLIIFLLNLQFARNANKDLYYTEFPNVEFNNKMITGKQVILATAGYK